MKSVVVVGTFLLLWRSERSRDTGWLQAAIIGLLVMASTIGEALLTPSAALLLGLGLRWYATHPRQASGIPPT